MTNDLPVPDMGAPSFNFQHLQLDEATARYPMRLVSPDAYLVVRPAMEFNKDFLQATLAHSGKRERIRKQAIGAQEGDEKQERKDDLEIYPGTVVVGWGGIMNTDGEPVPFTVDNCRVFLRALPGWLFERVRTFARIPDNFVAASAIPPNAKQVAELAGN